MILLTFIKRLGVVKAIVSAKDFKLPGNYTGKCASYQHSTLGFFSDPSDEQVDIANCFIHFLKGRDNLCNLQRSQSLLSQLKKYDALTSGEWVPSNSSNSFGSGGGALLSR